MRQESPRPSDGVTPPPASGGAHPDVISGAPAASGGPRRSGGPYRSADRYSGVGPYSGGDPYPGRDPQAAEDPYAGGDAYPTGPIHGSELVPVTRRRHGADEPDDPAALSPAALWAGLRASVAWRDLVAAVILAVVVAVTGIGTGALWAWLGPHVPVLMTVNGPILAEYYGESSVGQQATFGGLALAVGLVLGPLTYLVRRRRGPVVLLGLAVGCLAAAWISWKVGVWIGQDEYEALVQTAAPGREFSMPVELDAQGLLFLEPLVAVLGYVLVAAWSRYPDLKADPALNRVHGRHWGSRPPDQ